MTSLTSGARRRDAYRQTSRRGRPQIFNRASTIAAVTDVTANCRHRQAVMLPKFIAGGATYRCISVGGIGLLTFWVGSLFLPYFQDPVNGTLYFGLFLFSCAYGAAVCIRVGERYKAWENDRAEQPATSDDAKARV